MTSACPDVAVPSRNAIRVIAEAARVVAVLCGLVLALLASGAVVALTWRSGVASYLAIVPTMLGFAAFRFARTPHAPARPLRLTVGVLAVVSACILTGQTWPPIRSELPIWGVLLGGGIAIPVVAATIATRRPRLATWLLLVPAAVAMFRLPWIIVGYRALGERAAADDLSPSVAYAYLLASSTLSAMLVALWHSWDIPAAPLTTGAVAGAEP